MFACMKLGVRLGERFKGKRMKFLVTNQHTCNYGDDAAGIALFQLIKEAFPDASVDVVYNSHEGEDLDAKVPYSKGWIVHRNDIVFWRDFRSGFLKFVLNRFLKIPVKQHSGFERYMEVVESADVVFVSPCGANIGIYKDWQFLARIWMAVLTGKKVFFHLNTIGKSGSLLFDYVAKYVLKRSNVFVREKACFDELRGWGVCPSLGVDTAFSLRSEDISDSNFLGGKGERYLVLIPTNLGWHPNFGKDDSDKIFDILLPEIVRYAHENKLSVLILPHLYGSLDESPLLLDVQKRLVASGLDQKKVRIADEVSSVWMYQRAIKNASTVVSMRYHGIVFAAKNAVPFLSLSYENKMREVCAYVGKLNLHLDLKQLNAHIVAEKLKEIEDSREAISASLNSRSEFLRRKSTLVVDDLKLQMSLN